MTDERLRELSEALNELDTELDWERAIEIVRKRTEVWSILLARAEAVDAPWLSEYRVRFGSGDDPAAVVVKTTAHLRITVPRPRYRLVSAFGEEKSLSAWARDPRCRVSYHTLYARIARADWEPELAIETETDQDAMFTAISSTEIPDANRHGKRDSIVQTCIRIGGLGRRLLQQS